MGEGGRGGEGERLSVNADTPARSFSSRCCYLSLMWMGRFPFFHKMLAMGKAWGLHSRVTVVPALALSRALSRFPVKSGGEADGKWVTI